MLDISKAPNGPLLQKTCFYQPFILPDGVFTGAGLSQTSSTNLRSVEEGHPEADRFIIEARNQAAMYEQFLELVDKEVGFAGSSFLDVACNAGYFCYRASQRGAASSVGFDIGDFDSTFSIINSVLGTDAKFIRGSYSQRRHEFPVEMGSADIVFNIAFLCHMSDPTFVIEALAARAKKALLIFSKFPRDDDYVIRFSKATRLYSQKRFPMCFNGATEVSDALLAFALEDLGFTRVIEVPKQQTWVPRSESWRAFLALR